MHEKVTIEHLWMVRLLNCLSNPERIVASHKYAYTAFFNALGFRNIREHIPVDLSEYTSASTSDMYINPRKFVTTLLSDLEQYILKGYTIPEPHKGWRCFAKSLGLNEMEQKLFVFACSYSFTLSGRLAKLRMYKKSRIPSQTKSMYKRCR